MQMNGMFDASQFAPKQVGTSHPVGKFPARVNNTSIEPTKANDGGMFVVEFVTPAGSAVNRYNLWNSNPKTVEISQGQLSALCHATGIFRLNWENEGAALRGGNCQIEIADQLGEDGKPNGYTRIVKVFDANGNEPGKPAMQAPQPTAQPQQQWTQPPANPAPANAGGWNAPAQAPANPAPAQWTQGSAPAPASGGEKPPWAK